MATKIKQAKAEKTPKEEKKTVIVDLAEEKTKTVVVLKKFRDKFDHRTLYVPGQELELEATRATEIVERGLAEFKPADAGDTTGDGTPEAGNEPNSQTNGNNDEQ
jgi:hypothetical protein